jgi:hypothetical protein
VYGYLFKESLEFPELVCLDKHKYDFCFCTFEIMHSFGNTMKNSWFNGFISKECDCVGMKQQRKWRHIMNIKKTHDLFNKNDSFDKESLVVLYAKILTRLKQVKTDMIKQKAIIGQASSSHFGKSPIGLASPQQLL